MSESLLPDSPFRLVPCDNTPPPTEATNNAFSRFASIASPTLNGIHRTKFFYESASLKQYISVDKRPAEVIVANSREGYIIWMNDYPLRRAHPRVANAPIGFFLLPLFRDLPVSPRRYPGMKMIVRQDKFDEIQCIVFLHTEEVTLSQYLALLTVADAFLVMELVSGLCSSRQSVVQRRARRARLLYPATDGNPGFPHLHGVHFYIDNLLSVTDANPSVGVTERLYKKEWGEW
ncbi:hypothetical protein HD554DRAFT_2040950 [Boletus coccyginus]|nr:hypothetical protein HD554DRAFT_2040950 [Boletus coccyginus]